MNLDNWMLQWRSCRRALEIKPDFAGAHNNLGVALKELGQFAAAQASYQRALQSKPDYAVAHNNLGNVLKECGQLDAALASYRKAVEFEPDYAEAHSNLSILLKDLGQNEDALASNRRALELQPDYVEAQTNLLFLLNSTSGYDAPCRFRRSPEIRPDGEQESDLAVFRLAVRNPAGTAARGHSIRRSA